MNRKIYRHMIILFSISLVFFIAVECFIGSSLSFFTNSIIYVALTNTIFSGGIAILEVKHKMYTKFVNLSVKNCSIVTIIVAALFVMLGLSNCTRNVSNIIKETQKEEIEELNRKWKLHKEPYYRDDKNDSYSNAYNNDYYNNGYSYNSNSSHHSSHSYSYSYDFDPDDYDSAEDFADDAYGNFGDWDEAYEYWENY